MNSINAGNNSIINNRSTRSDNLGASLSFDELKYVTDVSFYFTTNALNVVVYFASAIVSIVIGFFGMGRDIEGSMEEVHDGEPVRVAFCLTAGLSYVASCHPILSRGALLNNYI